MSTQLLITGFVSAWIILVLLFVWSRGVLGKTGRVGKLLAARELVHYFRDEIGRIENTGGLVPGPLMDDHDKCCRLYNRIKPRFLNPLLPIVDDTDRKKFT